MPRLYRVMLTSSFNEYTATDPKPQFAVCNEIGEISGALQFGKDKRIVSIEDLGPAYVSQRYVEERYKEIMKAQEQFRAEHGEDL